MLQALQEPFNNLWGQCKKLTPGGVEFFYHRDPSVKVVSSELAIVQRTYGVAVLHVQGERVSDGQVEAIVKALKPCGGVEKAEQLEVFGWDETSWTHRGVYSWAKLGPSSQKRMGESVSWLIAVCGRYPKERRWVLTLVSNKWMFYDPLGSMLGAPSQFRSTTGPRSEKINEQTASSGSRAVDGDSPPASTADIASMKSPTDLEKSIAEWHDEVPHHSHFALSLTRSQIGLDLEP